MTFAEKRAEKLEEFDDAMARYREIMADPGMCNSGYGKLNDILKEINELQADIIKINNAEQC